MRSVYLRVIETQRGIFTENPEGGRGKNGTGGGIVKKYRHSKSCGLPRLIHAMQWVASLSEGEARACIRDYKAGLAVSSEAVNHFGRVGLRYKDSCSNAPLVVILEAIKARHVIRKHFSLKTLRLTDRAIKARIARMNRLA